MKDDAITMKLQCVALLWDPPQAHFAAPQSPAQRQQAMAGFAPPSMPYCVSVSREQLSQLVLGDVYDLTITVKMGLLKGA